MNRYALSAQARQDTDDIVLYLEQYSERAAMRFERELIAEFIALATLPVQYRQDPSVVPPPLRIRSFRNYLIFYDGTTRPVTILRVLHGSRNLASLQGGIDLDD